MRVVSAYFSIYGYELLEDELSHRATVLKVDVDASPVLASKFHVHSIPNFVVIKNGEVKERLVGVQSKEALRGAVEAHL